MSGTLFIVATPIGNLEDLTARARQTLAEVDLIAAEDTRHTGRLLSTIGVKRPLMSLHDHNEAEAKDSVIEVLRDGRDVALVSDAGTPLVSDPGYRLVAAAHDAGIRVTPIPGPSALTAALCVSGLATDRFCFEGFLPAKPTARRAALTALCREPRSMVFYESVHRIAGFLDDAVAAFGAARPAFIGRELTKLHEQCVSASLGGLAEQITSGSIVAKGEFVIVVAGSEDTDPAPAIDTDLLLKELSAELPARRAAALAAKLVGGRPNALYSRLLELSESAD
ncbi:MAG: 16S rRNA (cytidine(1402)-2'-O)-methyltransferase [Pseudomonadota bacterium]